MAPRKIFFEDDITPQYLHIAFPYKSESEIYELDAADILLLDSLRTSANIMWQI